MKWRLRQETASVFGESSSLNPVKKLCILKRIHLGLGIYSIVEQSVKISLSCIFFFHGNVPRKQFERWRIFFFIIAYCKQQWIFWSSFQFFLFNHNYFYLCCWVRSWQYYKAFDLLLECNLTKTKITKASRACLRAWEVTQEISQSLPDAFSPQVRQGSWSLDSHSVA